ncbi:hypothetical protein HF086_016429 [Spodoptera exigua]|uniref:CCHC-type domain-containing protein n=1 Tax=Spodoptera exigua TaxID=7107 RepID=A0A922MRL3_SPOEX|nr:hypothetical protein HF086_016429 [Spodoptera exigua]
MQLRLRGAARDWYDDLENYDLTWDGWKEMLRVAFPRSIDYADKLERMMARTKEDKESMTKYYHEKLSLLRKCCINGTDAISCIIRGLPIELRANAKAYSCETPEQLYFGYLSSLENFKRVESNSSRKSTWKRGGSGGGTTQESSSLNQYQPKICYTCRRPGHEAKNCRQQHLCTNCGRRGHKIEECWFAAGTSQPQKVSQNSHVLHITYDIYLDYYKKTVDINGHQLIAYIDTGSKLNILTISQAKKLKVKIEPSTIIMRGFGGACVNSLGSCQLNVLIDNVTLNGVVELTDYISSDIDLLIGQSMINSKGVSLVTSDSSVSFVESQIVQSALANIKLQQSDFIEKFSVYVKHQVNIPKQSQSYIEVYINDSLISGKECTFLTRTVWVQIGNMSYLIPSAIINSDHSYLKVVNLGLCDLIFHDNQLIARAELVTVPINMEKPKVFTVDNVEANNVQINLTDINLDDIVWGINNTPNATTGFSPFNLMFGHKNSRYPAFPSHVPSNSELQLKELQANRETAKLRIDRNMTAMKARFDKKRKKCIKYDVGQLVLWKGGVTRDSSSGVTRKLNGLYTGPYKVCKVDHLLDRYTITSIKGMKGYRKFSAVVRGETLRPYKPTMSEDDSSGSDHEVDRDDLIDLLES